MANGVVMRLTLAVAALVATACSTGDGAGESVDSVAPSSTSTTDGDSTTLAACADDRHLAVFDIVGTLTTDRETALSWQQDPQDDPPARPLAAELVNAYSDRGYEVLYNSILPEDFLIGGQPVADAYMGWLDRNGFPTDPGRTRVETSSTEAPTASELSADLTRIAGENVAIDVGYTDSLNDVESFGVAGVDKVYLLGPEDAGASATTIPEDDLAPQLAVVEALPRVCR